MTEGVAEPRELTEADDAAAALVAARAFAWHEPWAAWVLPDEATREGRLQELIEADIRERFRPLGRASVIEADGAIGCVALWIPPRSHPDADAFGGRRDEAGYAKFGAMGAALREADEDLDRLKPPGEYWYLDTLATDPGRMRRGLGGRLLDHELAALDELGEAAALDTHTPENVGFYERRGFEVVGRGSLPGDGPDLYVMLRAPRRP